MCKSLRYAGVGEAVSQVSFLPSPLPHCLTETGRLALPLSTGVQPVNSPLESPTEPRGPWRGERNKEGGRKLRIEINRVWTEPERRRVQCSALQMVVCYRSESGNLAAAAATSRGDSRYGKLQNS